MSHPVAIRSRYLLLMCIHGQPNVTAERPAAAGTIKPMVGALLLTLHECAVEGQMREMLCLHMTEAKSFVPSLEIGVLGDDGDTDCLGPCRPVRRHECPTSRSPPPVLRYDSLFSFLPLFLDNQRAAATHPPRPRKPCSFAGVGIALGSVSVGHPGHLQCLSNAAVSPAPNRATEGSEARLQVKRLVGRASPC